MATTVQNTYRPQIVWGTPGLVVDEVEYSIQTFVSETTAGIPFGVAVSQGTGDSGCILGGTHFLGVSVRDVTLSLANIDPQATGGVTLDTYPQYSNVGVLSRGHIWVLPGADVVANDPAYFNSVTGQITNSGTGVAATASITFATNPQPSQTVTIQGTAVTFVASAPTAGQVLIGPTLGDTVANLANVLNASADVNLVLMKYMASPPSPFGYPQGSGANQLYMAAKAVGTTANAYTLTTTTTGSTIVGFAGGLAGTNTLVTGARFATTAIAGQIAQLALGIQT